MIRTMDTTRIARLVIIAATIGIVGCTKDAPAPVDLGSAYYPTNAGHWVEYQVDSSWVDQENNIEGSLTYSLRERIENDFTDPEGRPAQRILREVKDSLGNWGPKDVWWQMKDNFRVERAEENLRKIKLVFPVRGSQTWNTNAENTLEPLELTYDAWDEPWSANGLSFDSTCLVRTTFVNNLVDTVRYFERYAKNVGLVYRQLDNSETQYVDTDDDGDWDITYTVGTSLRMTVFAHGN